MLLRLFLFTIVGLVVASPYLKREGLINFDLLPWLQPIALNSDNLQAKGSLCESPDSCIFTEDPWDVYKRLKQSNNGDGISNLVKFLETKINDPKFKDMYAETLKAIVDDFYPQALRLPETISSEVDLANFYYKMKRFNEALPYYKKAIEGLSVSEAKNSESANFIRSRIAELEQSVQEPN